MNKTFFLNLPSQHPMIKNHTIFGQALMPGLAYIDMLYQLAINKLSLDYREYCLKKLSILRPLSIGKDETKKIKINFSKKQENWLLGVEDAEIDAKGNINIYIDAILEKNIIPLTNQLDIQAIIKSSFRKTDLEYIYSKARQRELVHENMIKAKGAIYFYPDGLLADVAVDDVYQDFSEMMLFQPTLIDGAAMAATYSIDDDAMSSEKGGLFIPLSFDAFYGKKPLKQHCYASVKKSTIRIANDIIIYDLDFYDAGGNQISSLQGITSKIVRNHNLFISPIKKTSVAKYNVKPGKKIEVDRQNQILDSENLEKSNQELSLKKIFSRYIDKSIEQIDSETSFFELGLESSMLLNIVKEIENTFDLSLNTSLLFEYHNLNQLVTYLNGKIASGHMQSSQPHQEAKENTYQTPESHISLASHVYEFYGVDALLADYLVNKKPALMTVSYPCLVLDNYLKNNQGAYPLLLKNINFMSGPLTLTKGDKLQVQVQYNKVNGTTGFEITAYFNDSPQPITGCQGDVSEKYHETPEHIDIDTIIKKSHRLDKNAITNCYRTIKNYQIGSTLQIIESIYEYNKLTQICSVDLSRRFQERTSHRLSLDPAVLFSCFILSNYDAGNQDCENTILPVKIENLILYREITGKAYIIKNIRTDNKYYTSFDAMILTESGEIVAEIINATVKFMRQAELALFNNPVKKSDAKEESRDIAIIGLAGRYPGAKNVDEFYLNLKNAKDSITEVPETRWSWKKYFSENRNQPGTIYCKWGGFMEGVDEFDPLFFNISPTDAEIMDPQERLFLQCCYHVLEDAGYTRNNLAKNGNTKERNKIGVYVGVMWDDYQLYGVQEQANGKMIALSDNSSSIANRVSYIFNFHGPSLVVNSACSSSLTALHLACQSIINKESELALAGGVNVCVHPNKYLFLSINGFISSKGRCESFGIGADGYVPGEGVGAVLLKPLAKAIADGDHIYGIIKGSTINAGGKTSGFTVPSPKAQGEVINGAIKVAGLDPRAISYIETHGTGTSLGDPVEIKGLTDVFNNYTKDKQFCRIGSVKSNIGHLESAAGIAGITKILLQLKHQQLVPSLHSKSLNPDIDFANTPFLVQQELEEWKRPVLGINGEKKEFPRVAGISSFGAGGSNAHIIIEEYIAQNSEEAEIRFTPQNPAVVVLSAKDEERLMELVKQMLSFLEENQLPEKKLADFVYTLQTGREAREERLALVVSSVGELKLKLHDFVQGQRTSSGLFRGRVKENEGTLAILEADDDMGKTIEAWIAKRKHTKLAGLWVKGMAVDWNKLYDKVKPQRMSLPTYPFARERYWVPEVNGRKNNLKNRILTEFIHPLLHQNTSDFFEQRFSSVFTGNEFFLKDHVVSGQKVLPGVAYLEMIRGAVEYAAGASKDGGTTGLRLKDLVWLRPLVVTEESIEVHIGLNPSENGEISYEVYTDSETSDTQPLVYHQGLAYINFFDEAPILDLEALQSECAAKSVNIKQFYEDLQSMGLDYGPGFRGIEFLFLGTDKVLARLSLPVSVYNTWEQYVMHPSLMDSALHATAALLALTENTESGNGRKSHKPILPFALQELELYNSCTSSMWALIRASELSKKEDKIKKIDIDLCDDQGRICIRIKGFSTRTLEKEIPHTEKQEFPSSGTHNPPLIGSILLSPVWNAVKAEKGKVFPGQQDKIVIIGGTKDSLATFLPYYPKANMVKIGSNDGIEKLTEKLKKYDFIDHIIWLAPSNPLKSLVDEALIKDQNQGVLQVFRIMKALLNLGYAIRDLGWTVITWQAQPIEKKEGVNPTHTSIHGLIGSLAKEYPNWKFRLMDLEEAGDWPLDSMFSILPDSRGRAWVYRSKQWYRQQLLPVQQLPMEQTVYRTNGVYVVIGGAGNVGQAWTEYMMRTYQAHIIWLGRREKDAVIQAKLDALAGLGAVPLYIRVDAGDQKALKQAYDEIKKKYPQIHGVIHSAMDLSEQSLADLDEQRFKAGLAVKVDVCVRLAQVFYKESLDFIMFFSSIVAFIKNPKQSYYAAGCTFKDAFAHQLSLELSCKVKIMNWGYWSTDETKASERVQLMSQLGLDLIEPPEAMAALESLLAGSLHQIGLIKINKTLQLEGMNPEEFIMSYPEKISSTGYIFRNKGTNHEAQAEKIQSELEPSAGEMDELLYRLLWTQLSVLGLFQEKTATINELKTKAGLYSLYERWLEESLIILAREKYLQFDGKTCTFLNTTPVKIEGIWKKWEQKKEVWLKDPHMKVRAILLEATMRSLPEILTKKALATDVIFPESSMALIEGVYKNNPVSDYFNEVLTDTLITYIQERSRKDPAVQIRILEIGAGTGGTSAPVFAKLRDYSARIKEYCYTDISKAFLMYAENEYGKQNPYLTYKIFHVEKPAVTQGIHAGEYDIVIAANVLHATKNIRQTLRNAKAVLKKNGLLLLNEMSKNNLFVHLTFGLLEGWWLHEDSELRIPGCPGLFPEKWKTVLESEGFYPVFFTADRAHDLGQQIIVAESDGIIRQKQNLDTNLVPDTKNKSKILKN